jgi:hypothetical protein
MRSLGSDKIGLTFDLSQPGIIFERVPNVALWIKIKLRLSQNVADWGA